MSKKNITRLNIGCGPNPLSGFINLDIHPFPGVDIIHDIQLPWPFSESSMSHVKASHVLEHIQDLIFVINQAWFCLKPTGIFEIDVPWWSGTWARGDPTHVRFFDHNSFNPFSDWHDSYKYLGISGPWLKLSQNYSFESSSSAGPFLKKMGFSSCLSMHVVLQKP